MKRADAEKRSSSIEQGEMSDPLKPKQADKPDRNPFDNQELTLKIDRMEIRVSLDSLDNGHLTGEQLRKLVEPPIDHGRDLFEVVVGGSDKKIEDTALVEIYDWQRFFSAPTQINPG